MSRQIDIELAIPGRFPESLLANESGGLRESDSRSRESQPKVIPENPSLGNHDPLIAASTYVRFPKTLPYGKENQAVNPHTPDPSIRGEESRSLGSLLPSPDARGGRAEAPLLRVAEPDQDAGTARNRSPGNRPQAGTAPTLRPYQRAAIDSIEDQWRSGIKRTLLVLPTGCGKTVVFAEIIRCEVDAGGRALVLAHRTELLEQARNKLRDVGVRAELEQGQLRADPRVVPVVVASVQTLRGARLERYAHDAFTVIVVDEGHHAAAKSYRNILAHFPDARVLYVTATPDRGDGAGLKKAAGVESVAFTYEMRRAISERFLAPLVAKRVVVNGMNLSTVRSHHGDFDQNELSNVLNEERNLQGVVDPLMREVGDRRTLVFGVDVAHAKALAEVLNSKKSGSAIALDGTAKSEERKAVLALFRRGAFQYLVNCALFTEGFDEPSIQAVAMVRPTQSRALYTQMLGRGTRPLGATMDESIANGKTNCLILDFVGNSGKHKLVGPADALAGGDLPDDVRKKAEEGMDGQTELDSVLDHAEAEVEKQKREKRAKLNGALLVEYRTREIDLFLGDLLEAFDADSPEASMPATDEQLALIDKARLGKPPAGISRAEAESILRAVKSRSKAGLCTIPQARLLETRLKCDTKGMTFDRAHELIGKVSAMNAWQAPWRALSDQPEFQPNRRRA